MDANLLIGGFSAHIRVLDLAAMTDIRTLDNAVTCDIGGYCIIARRTDSWDAITSILVSLDAEHVDYFHQVMRGCRALSNVGYEPDVQNLPAVEEQSLFDLFIDREQRREQQGYVAPEEARAFLQAARGANISCPPKSVPTEGLQVTGAPLQMMRVKMRFLFDHDRSVYGQRTEEISYLANTLTSGCALQGRPFAAQEASSAAVSVCNLGLEKSEAPGNDFLLNHDLTKIFQIGWAALYRDVCIYAATQFMAVLADLHCADRYIQKDINVLRTELARWCEVGTPWRARAAMDVITMLDAPIWAALLGLLAEYPVLHAAISLAKTRKAASVHASDFQFISETRHIAEIREFMGSLPQALQSSA
jgi:hypothetical protein